MRCSNYYIGFMALGMGLDVNFSCGACFHELSYLSGTQRLKKKGKAFHWGLEPRAKKKRKSI